MIILICSTLLFLFVTLVCVVVIWGMRQQNIALRKKVTQANQEKLEALDKKRIAESHNDYLDQRLRRIDSDHILDVQIFN